jgi:murein DD-endopeptidase MepM/ murein hydrolase activator NlpD
MSGTNHDIQPIRPGAIITCRFGHDTDPVAGGYRFHRALDRARGDGLVYCPLPANRAVIEDPAGDYGTLIRLIYDGFEIRLAHCRYFTQDFQRLVAAQEPIPAGMSIALEGSLGKSTGPHTHIELIAVRGRNPYLDGQLAAHSIDADVYWPTESVQKASEWMKKCAVKKLGPIECLGWDRRNNCWSIWMDPFAVLGV